MSFMDSLRRLLQGASAASGARKGLRERVVQCQGPHGLHRMAYTEWGDPRMGRPAQSQGVDLCARADP